MPKLALTQGRVALVSKKDYKRRLPFNWIYNRVQRWAQRTENGTTILLHRFIMDEPDGQIDHKNFDRLNNFRRNLRVCTHLQNCQHRLRYKGNYTSKYKGVNWNPASDKWMARIGVNFKRIYLGCFDTETEAAIAYNSAALQFHGKFAELNKIES